MRPTVKVRMLPLHMPFMACLGACNSILLNNLLMYHSVLSTIAYDSTIKH